MLRAVVPGLVATVTTDAAATSKLAAQAAQRGDDLLAVLGGDGTAHLAAQAVAGTGTALAVLPSGSGNDLAAAILVAVGNGPCYGGGLRICPGATLTDGLLDVIAIAAVSRRRLLRVFPRLRVGGHIDEPEVTVLRGATVRLEGFPGWPVYADGEPQGTLPVIVHCEPGALTVVA
jgi:diacylglycerol kinase family enzyme